MYAVNHFEQSRLRDTVGIHMRKRKPGVENSVLTNADISSLTNNSDILQNSYMFMKNIRGTAAYWNDILHNLLATVKSLGPPTIFLTLSADDLHWPELIMLLMNIPYEEAIQIRSCSSQMCKDPLLASLYFEKRWTSFLKHCINGKKNHSE